MGYGPLADVLVATGSGAPSNGTTGANVTPPGSIYIDVATGNVYVNSGTKASPTWSVVSVASLSATELGYIDGTTPGTQAANKVVVPNDDVNIGVVKCTQLHVGATGSETQVTATGEELNYVDVTTAGTAQASKALIVDANIDITGIGNVTSSKTNASTTPGTIRNHYSKVTTGAVALASGNLVGSRGEVLISTGASVGSGVFLYGQQGKIDLAGAATIDAGSGYVCGLLGQLDLTDSTNTSGHIAAVIASIQGVGSSGTPVNLFYGESATGTVINSFFQAFGKSTYVFDLESNTHDQMSTTGTSGATAGKGWLKVLVEGAVRYIPLTDSVS